MQLGLCVNSFLYLHVWFYYLSRSSFRIGIVYTENTFTQKYHAILCSVSFYKLYIYIYIRIFECVLFYYTCILRSIPSHSEYILLQFCILLISIIITMLCNIQYFYAYLYCLCSVDVYVFIFNCIYFMSPFANQPSCRLLPFFIQKSESINQSQFSSHCQHYNFSFTTKQLKKDWINYTSS